MSFRQEKFISKGGPDGGDGGHGGNVVMVASRNQNTLASFRYQKELIAEPGQSGGKKRMHGKNGKDLEVAVPVGTVVSDLDGKVLADLVEDGQRAVIAKGGRGGFGNAHFVSSTRQAPRFSEKGADGQEFEAMLELKMIADVGLVGLPNAGKSTLLSKISNARPEIANYPFTTLKPNLGMVDIGRGESSLLFADIPGLIEGAAEGKGLGHEFLRHIERTAVILHLIDAYNDDVAEAYRTIQDELAAYDVDLSERPQIVVLNKIDGLDEDIVNDLKSQLQKVIPEGADVQAISAVSGEGVKDLLYAVNRIVTDAREKRAAELAEEDAVPVYRLEETESAWSVSEVDGVFVVSGSKIEQFAARTKFDNEEAVQRLRDIMKKMGILHELTRKGIEPGQEIRIGNYGSMEY